MIRCCYLIWPVNWLTRVRFIFLGNAHKLICCTR
uniref:Uncharacterized protein n=1 Tax=Arundo donax TaxID=35708 RepID=A0A0A9AKU8_ARUDO